MTDKPQGSTGNAGQVIGGFAPTISHDAQPNGHVVVIEGQGEADMPGTVPLQKIVIDGKTYTHVGEDIDAIGTVRWVYRPL